MANITVQTISAAGDAPADMLSQKTVSVKSPMMSAGTAKIVLANSAIGVLSSLVNAVAMMTPGVAIK